MDPTALTDMTKHPTYTNIAQFCVQLAEGKGRSEGTRMSPVEGPKVHKGEGGGGGGGKEWR